MKTKVVGGVQKQMRPEERLETLIAKYGIEIPAPKKPAPEYLYTGLPPELTDRQNKADKSLAILNGVGRMLGEMAVPSTSAERREELSADSKELLVLWERLYNPKTDERGE